MTRPLRPWGALAMAAAFLLLPLAGAAETEDTESHSESSSESHSESESSSESHSGSSSESGSESGDGWDDGVSPIEHPGYVGVGPSGEMEEQDESGHEAEDEDDEVDDRPDSFETAPNAQDNPVVGFNVTERTGILVQGNETVLSTLMQGLSEFRDADGNGRYDLGEPVLQAVPLGGINGTLASAGNGTRHVDYPLPNGGHLSLIFHLAPGDARRPAKFDVLVDGFPFQAPDSRLAVSVRIQVAGGFRFATVEGDPALVGLGPDAPFLSWDPQVTVDGRTEAVGASLHVAADAAASEGVLTWSYPQGANITHDPVLGTVLQPASMPSPGLPPMPTPIGDLRAVAWAAAAGLALLAVGLAVRSRRRA